MGWLAEIANGIGAGASGGAVAAAIYAGAVAVDKEARTEAKRDIASFLKGFTRGFEVSLLARHISHIFEIVFGERQLTGKCVSRSLIATLIFFFVSFAIVFLKRHDWLNLVIDESGLRVISMPGWLAATFVFAVSAFMFSALPDYLSLWKSRALLRLVSRSRSLIKILLIVVIDVFSSITVFLTWLVLLSVAFGKYDTSHLVPWQMTKDILDTFPATIKGYYALIDARTTVTGDLLIVPLFLTSTLLTSVWTLGFFISAITVRGAISLRYPLKLLAWLFDVDEHPVRIIGIFLAAFAWTGIVIYGLV
jgi:hypothetical protein